MENNQDKIIGLVASNRKKESIKNIISKIHSTLSEEEIECLLIYLDEAQSESPRWVSVNKTYMSHLW